MTQHDRITDEAAARLFERFGVRSITIELHRPSVAMPDADTDVLIFDGSCPDSQLGAYVGEDEDGPIWVNAQGEGVANVIAWAEMPRIPVGVLIPIKDRAGNVVERITKRELAERYDT